MKSISIYDTDAKVIEETCNANDMSEAELIELLMYYIGEVKEDGDLK